MDTNLEHRARYEVLWSPRENAWAQSAMGSFGSFVGKLDTAQGLAYQDLWKWSVDDLEGFWRAVVDFFGLDVGAPNRILEGTNMPDVHWLPGSKVSYPYEVLRRAPSGTAVVGLSQCRDRVELTGAELSDAVARCRAGLVSLGVGCGDVVAAYLPNIPETIVAFLASASIGATWVSCAPEFGASAVVARLSQLSPKVLLSVEGYGYGSKWIDRRAALEEITGGLPSLVASVVVPYGSPRAATHHDLDWDGLLGDERPLEFERVPFNHPLYVLFSSGTTGPPKGIVHGHGGILLEHLKALVLHHDLNGSDRFFWFTTTGWMMWNYLVSGLLAGSRIVCFDGDPMFPEPEALWNLASAEALTFLGTSAPFLATAARRDQHPKHINDLSHLRSIGSTGSPLAPAVARWIRSEFGESVRLECISGGTDVCSAFFGTSPVSSIRAGEMSGPLLGCDAEVLDDQCQPVVDAEGELTVKSPMPSMPVALIGDATDRLLHSTYYAANAGRWTHGDRATLRVDGGCVISGRSDATINRGGVRAGTAEFYAVLDPMNAVADSLVIHLDSAYPGEDRLLLFLVRETSDLGDDALIDQVRRTLHEELSPRHVPSSVHVVASLPRTLSGKKLEVPLKRILRGASPASVLDRSALRDPGSLDQWLADCERMGLVSSGPTRS